MASIEVSDETGSSTVVSTVVTSMDATAIADNVTSSSPDINAEGQTENEEGNSSDGKHFFLIPRVKKLPWHIFLFQTFNCICP